MRGKAGGGWRQRKRRWEEELELECRRRIGEDKKEEEEEVGRGKKEEEGKSSATVSGQSEGSEIIGCRLDRDTTSIDCWHAHMSSPSLTK